MTRETLWLAPRSPGDDLVPSARENDGTRYETAAVVGDFYSTTDSFRIPPETPHPRAGDRVRVTRRFRSYHPRTGGGCVAHVWAESVGLGVAETPEGFIVYEIEGWPDWPRVDEVIGK